MESFFSWCEIYKKTPEWEKYSKRQALTIFPINLDTSISVGTPIIYLESRDVF